MSELESASYSANIHPLTACFPSFCQPGTAKCPSQGWRRSRSKAEEAEGANPAMASAPLMWAALHPGWPRALDPKLKMAWFLATLSWWGMLLPGGEKAPPTAISLQPDFPCAPLLCFSEAPPSMRPGLQLPPPPHCGPWKGGELNRCPVRCCWVHWPPGCCSRGPGGEMWVFPWSSAW